MVLAHRRLKGSHVREAGDAPKTYVARNTKRRFAGVNPVSSQLFALCEWMCVRFFLLFKWHSSLLRSCALFVSTACCYLETSCRPHRLSKSGRRFYTLFFLPLITSPPNFFAIVCCASLGNAKEEESKGTLDPVFTQPSGILVPSLLGRLGKEGLIKRPGIGSQFVPLCLENNRKSWCQEKQHGRKARYTKPMFPGGLYM